MMLTITVILLVPWWVVSYRSSGVFLYPLVKGTQRPDFETYNLHLPLSDTLRFIGVFFFSSGYLWLFLPVCLVKAGRERRRLLFMAVAILLISSVFISQLTFTAYFDLYRYLAPIGLAFALCVAGVVTRQLLESVPVSGARFDITAGKAKVVAISAIAVLFVYDRISWSNHSIT